MIFSNKLKKIQEIKQLRLLQADLHRANLHLLSKAPFQFASFLRLGFPLLQFLIRRKKT